MSVFVQARGLPGALSELVEATEGIGAPNPERGPRQADRHSRIAGGEAPRRIFDVAPLPKDDQLAVVGDPQELLLLILEPELLSQHGVLVRTRDGGMSAQRLEYTTTIVDPLHVL